MHFVSPSALHKYYVFFQRLVNFCLLGGHPECAKRDIPGLHFVPFGPISPRIVRKSECAAGATNPIDCCCHKSSNACGRLESRSNNCRVRQRVGLGECSPTSVHPVNVIVPRINDLPEHQTATLTRHYRRYTRICSMPLPFRAIRVGSLWRILQQPDLELHSKSARLAASAEP